MYVPSHRSNELSLSRVLLKHERCERVGWTKSVTSADLFIRYRYTAVSLRACVLNVWAHNRLAIRLAVSEFIPWKRTSTPTSPSDHWSAWPPHSVLMQSLKLTRGCHWWRVLQGTGWRKRLCKEQCVVHKERKTTYVLDKQHQHVDQTYRGGISQNDKRQQRSIDSWRMADELNRTKQQSTELQWLTWRLNPRHIMNINKHYFKDMSLPELVNKHCCGCSMNGLVFFGRFKVISKLLNNSNEWAQQEPADHILRQR